MARFLKAVMFVLFWGFRLVSHCRAPVWVPVLLGRVPTPPGTLRTP